MHIQCSTNSVAIIIAIKFLWLGMNHENFMPVYKCFHSYSIYVTVYIGQYCLLPVSIVVNEWYM